MPADPGKSRKALRHIHRIDQPGQYIGIFGELITRTSNAFVEPEQLERMVSGGCERDFLAHMAALKASTATLAGKMPLEACGRPC